MLAQKLKVNSFLTSIEDGLLEEDWKRIKRFKTYFLISKAKIHDDKGRERASRGRTSQGRVLNIKYSGRFVIQKLSKLNI